MEQKCQFVPSPLCYSKRMTDGLRAIMLMKTIKIGGILAPEAGRLRVLEFSEPTDTI
jgi:hypothetical protein